jgi:hypothetical protein
MDSTVVLFLEHHGRSLAGAHYRKSFNELADYYHLFTPAKG